jgi:hypothetical protein
MAKPEVLHEVQEGPSVQVIQLGTAAEHKTHAKLAENINTKSTSGSVSRVIIVHAEETLF